MSVITEIREFRIPPCRVDKDLVSKLGKVLESKSNAHYSLDAWSRRIESDTYGEFIAADWPNDIKSINIAVGVSYPPPIYIGIDLRFMSASKVTVSSNDATWADGMSRQLERVFKEKELRYALIVERWYLRLMIAILTWLSMSIAFSYLVVETGYLSTATGSPSGEVFLVIFGVVGMMGGFWGLYYLFEWLFPRLEYGEPIQKRVRKWIWALLVSSGFLTTLVFELLGS